MNRVKVENMPSNEVEEKDDASGGPSPLRLAFGRRLRTLRHHRVMSQRVLATTSSVSMNTIGSIERGLRFPSPEVLESLAGALDVEVKEMFDVDDHAAPVTLEGAARELCRVVNDDLLPRVEALTQLANKLLVEIDREHLVKPEARRSTDRSMSVSAA
ncbi:MAG: helix-turn-helix transcriptional regulator [Pseudomonadota bacterium]